MKKLLVIFFGLGLIWGFGFNGEASAFMPSDKLSEFSKFASAKSKITAPDASDALKPSPEEAELQRLRKLANERIKEAEQLKIREKAKEIVECLTGKASFIFTNAKSELMIKLGVEIKDTQNLGRITKEITEIFYKKQLEFRSVFSISHHYDAEGYNDTQIYRPGEWMKELESLHKKAMSKKEEEGKNEIQKKIRDLKERFGL